MDSDDIPIDEGFVLAEEISQTTKEQDDKILVEKKIIKVVKEEEEEPLLETDAQKCCTHCYLVVVKGLVTVFVIPALIVASIVAWAAWLVLLPVTCCCPCCEICTAIVKFIWKFLSTVPVYLSDWVCNKESDDDRYQMARKKKKKLKGKKKSKKRKSYASMETQTALDDIESKDTTVGDLLDNNDLCDGEKNSVNFQATKTDLSDVTNIKKVSFREDDVMLLDDGLTEGGTEEEVLLDCGIPMEGMGRHVSAMSGTYNSGNISRDLEAQVEESYMSCTDNELTSSSESEEDLIYIE